MHKVADAEEARDIGKPVASNLGEVTQCVLGEVVSQLKQVGRVKEEVEALRQAQAHTAQGLTYLATVSAVLLCYSQSLTGHLASPLQTARSSRHLPWLCAPQSTQPLPP